MSTLGATATTLYDAMTAYVDACAAVTEADWVRQGPPRGWSMAETTEHVATTNTGIDRIVGALRALEDGEAVALDDEEINVSMFGDVGNAPGPGPTGSWTDASQAMLRFEESMQALLERADTDEEGLRVGVFEHPVFGLMDGVQWLRFAAVHTESHRVEISELRGGTLSS